MSLENLQIEFTGREITAWGGISLLKKMAFQAHLNSLALPIQKSNRGYDPVQIIEQYTVSVMVWRESVLNIWK